MAAWRVAWKAAWKADQTVALKVLTMVASRVVYLELMKADHLARQKVV